MYMLAMSSNVSPFFHGILCKGFHGRRVTHLIQSKKENLLSNSDNKQNVIDLLCETFKANGIDCVNAPADADVMVAKKGIEHARKPWHM